LGADYYLTKPFSVARLMEIVNEFSGMRDRDYSVGVDAGTLIRQQEVLAGKLG